MTLKEFEVLAIEAANRTSRIGHIECPREVRNPGVYFGMMLAAEVLLPLLEVRTDKLDEARIEGFEAGARQV